MITRISLITFFVLSTLTVHAQGIRKDALVPKPEAEQILSRYYKLIHTAKSIHIVEQMEAGGQTGTLEYWILKPGVWRSVAAGPNRNGKKELLKSFSDGENGYSINGETHTYDIFDSGNGPGLDGLEPYTDPKQPDYISAGILHDGSFNGKSAYVIPTEPQSIPGSMMYVYIDRSTLLPIGKEYYARGRGEFMTYPTCELNTRMNPADFKWTPPSNYTVRIDTRRSSMFGEDNPELRKRLKHLPQHSKPTPASKAKAKQIASQMTNLYKAMRTYSDVGECVSMIDSGALPMTEKLQFSIDFKRPGMFRFAYTESMMGRKQSYLILASGQKKMLTEGGSSQMRYVASTKTPFNSEKDQAIGMAIAAFTGISRSTSFTVPTMLMPEENDDVLSFADMKDLNYEGQESIEGHKCFRLYSKEQNAIYWIDAQSYLLRRVEEYYNLQEDPKGPPQMSIDRATYHPKVNLNIADSKFKS